MLKSVAEICHCAPHDPLAPGVNCVVPSSSVRLICAVHWREEGYLPGSRIEMYDNCCKMLLELRDVKREVKKEAGPLGALTLDDKEMILPWRKRRRERRQGAYRGMGATRTRPPSPQGD